MPDILRLIIDLDVANIDDILYGTEVKWQGNFLFALILSGRHCLKFDINLVTRA
ncbi:hypothetical protein RINTHH_22010 [Richelia intracellularis HH01]|uniref:Uncharacterized protein n=1 Tax=Richelia intracellularis HH01 TaxID=1165094 RepID=M1X6Q2_9NOST|nr:hypothetical protein RINTHH_22010 [Richelia intracellularis HH01]